jgi:hypothetical protein
MLKDPLPALPRSPLFGVFLVDQRDNNPQAAGILSVQLLLKSLADGSWRGIPSKA